MSSIINKGSHVSSLEQLQHLRDITIGEIYVSSLVDEVQKFVVVYYSVSGIYTF